MFLGAESGERGSCWQACDEKAELSTFGVQSNEEAGTPPNLQTSHAGSNPLCFSITPGETSLRVFLAATKKN
jgi:hypothetical protein